MANFLKNSKAIIGMIHVDPLPGTPKYRGNFPDIVKKALKEAQIYKKAGIDIIAIENMHDLPYLNRLVGPEITASMSVIGFEIKSKLDIKCGIQILAGANKEALSAAFCSGLDFIRAEGFVFAHIADEGIMEGCAGELLRYRRIIGAENILILTDIKKKHSSNLITSDVDICETAKAAEFFLSDGIIVTGVSTAKEADINELQKVKNSVNIPVITGSGVTIENVEKYLKVSDALIIGSYFKHDGLWSNEVDPTRVKALMDKVKEIKKKIL